jgi:hypothetical protein
VHFKLGLANYRHGIKRGCVRGIFGRKRKRGDGGGTCIKRRLIATLLQPQMVVGNSECTGFGLHLVFQELIRWYDNCHGLATTNSCYSLTKRITFMNVYESTTTPRHSSDQHHSTSTQTKMRVVIIVTGN